MEPAIQLPSVSLAEQGGNGLWSTDIPNMFTYSHTAGCGIREEVQAFTCTRTPQTQQFNALIRLPYLIGFHVSKFGAVEEPGFLQLHVQIGAVLGLVISSAFASADFLSTLLHQWFQTSVLKPNQGRGEVKQGRQRFVWRT